jgi:hypothetical protein
MNNDIAPLSNSEGDRTDMPAVFSRWYDVHPAVRRLRAVEVSSVVHILLTLEPTSDGADTLPVWFANRSVWTCDLQSLTKRKVELRMRDAIMLDDFSLKLETVILAELNWRDPLGDAPTG